MFSSELCQSRVSG